MARPRRSTRQEFFDVFADFDLADQAIVLEFLAEQHRQNKRTAAKRADDRFTERMADARDEALGKKRLDDEAPALLDGLERERGDVVVERAMGSKP